MYLAPEASRLPIAFPTRVDAAMPIRKTKASYQLGVFVEDDDAPYRCQTGLCSKLVEGLKGESGLLLGIRRLTLVGRHDYGLRCEWDGT